MIGKLTSLSSLTLMASVVAGCAHETLPLPQYGSTAPPPNQVDAARVANIVCSIPMGKERMSLAEAMQRYHVPGISAAVMINGELVWATSWGLADRERGVPMTPNTVLQAASVSKVVTSVAIMRMVTAGKLNLDKDVSDEIDWHADWQGRREKITLRELLSHSAGLNIHGFGGYQVGTPIPDTMGVLEGKGNTPPVAAEEPAFTKTVYSGGGFIVAQAVVESEVESPFPIAMNDWVLQPMGMHRSTFGEPFAPEWAATAAHGYSANGQPVVGGWHIYPEEAAAGLWTTPSDLLRMASGLYHGFAGQPSPISRDAVEALLTPTSTDQAVGIGWMLAHRPDANEAWHNGANAGFSSIVIWDTKGNGVAVLANGEGDVPSGLAESIGEEYGFRHSAKHGCPK